MKGEAGKKTDLIIVGGGPGGYTAAFRAADLGMRTTLVDVRERPGGVCLFVGCIPSKALLHAAAVVNESRRAAEFGVTFKKPAIDVDKLREWKDSVVNRLTGGVSELAKRRGVEFIRGQARFLDSENVEIEGSGQKIRFKHAIVATGSRSMELPGMETKSSRLMNSTGALALEDVPDSLLVVGGGYIGLELGTVYAALGSRVTVVEMTEGLLPGVDRDLVRPLEKSIRSEFEEVYLETKVVGIKEKGKGLEVSLEGKDGSVQRVFDKVLVAVGRRPNSEEIGLENTRVKVNRQGFVEIDHQCRTDDPKIYAIGDVAGQPMLAHKGMREGKVAVEAIAGQPSSFDNVAIPAVVFTDPEVAWCGLTESEARREGRKIKVSRFPWGASGRAITLGRPEGLTKMVLDEETGRILGVGITGPQAGELIAEATLAVEMAAVAEDLASTIHAHPTLSETVGEAAEAFLGHATHIFRK
jgi:dihydrolipoamide dehydrogenase